MTPERPPIPWEMLSLYATITLAIGCAWAARGTIRAAAREIPRSTWAGLGAAALLHAAIALWWVPGGPIEPNNHGYDRFVTIRDATLLGVYEGEKVHGGGWFALIRPFYLMFGGAVSPEALNVGLAATGILALGVAVRLALADDAAAVFAALSLALIPDQLRSSHSVSMFTASQAGLAVAWVAIELHLRDKRLATLIIAAAATLVSMQTHLEMQALTPLAVAAWLTARDPAWWRSFDRGRLAVVGLSLLLYVPHLIELTGFPFNQVFVTLGHADRQAIARAAILRSLLLFFAVWALRRGFSDAVDASVRAPDRRVDVGVIAVALGGLLYAAPGIAPLLTTPYAGANVLPDASRVGASVHAVFDVNHTSPLVPWAAALGVVALLARSAAFALMIAGVGAVMAFIYGGKWDCWSTEVRGVVTLATLVAIPAGVGIAELHRAVGRRAGGVVAAVVAAGWLGVGFVPYTSMLAYDWSFLQEHRVLKAAHALAAQGERVHVLGVADTARIPDPLRFALFYYRHYAGFMVGAYERPAPGLDALLAEPDPAGRYAVLPLTCYRGLYASSELAGRTVDLVWVDGRVYAVPAGRIALTGPDRQDPASNSVAHQLVPCWADRSLGQCADPDPAAPEGCRTWTCPPGPLPSPPDRPFLDATCAAVREQLVLEPVLEVVANPGATGTSITDLLDPSPQIGLYRVLGRR